MGDKFKSRTVLISNGYESLLRAGRRHRNPDRKFITTYSRHRWKVEGMHGQAKTQYGLKRAVRRGLGNVAIQAYLTAAVINLKRLVTYADGLYSNYLSHLAQILALINPVVNCEKCFGNNMTSFYKFA